VQPTLEQLMLGGSSEAWRGAGFDIAGAGMRVGAVNVHLGPGEGILGWRLSSNADTGIDGLPQAAPVEMPAPTPHPNGATHIDHLVVFTPDLARTTRALEGIGVESRRVREMETGDGTARQGFFRLGEVILEVVEHPRVEEGPARFWGITFAVQDLDAAAELLGDRLGSIGDAVQPGRRIATVRGAAELGLPVALISADHRP
jgi:hypothetical protein